MSQHEGWYTDVFMANDVKAADPYLKTPKTGSVV